MKILRALAWGMLAIAAPSCAVFAAGADGAGRSAVDPARRRAAEEFALSVGLKEQLVAANEISAGQIEAGLLRQVIASDPKAKEAREQNPERFEKIMARLQSVVSAEVRKMNSELEPTVYNETLDIYARTFNEAELREIQAFYASALGKKLLAKQPELMKECMAMAQRLMVQKMPALIAALRSTIQENGLELSED